MIYHYAVERVHLILKGKEILAHTQYAKMGKRDTKKETKNTLFVYDDVHDDNACFVQYKLGSISLETTKT